MSAFLRRGRLRAAVLAAVVVGMLLAVLPPAAARTRQILFPTEAAVTGAVELDGRPAARAALLLDGDNGSVTDAKGRFRLTDVGDGRHRLRVEAGGAPARHFEFTIPAGARDADVGVIEVEGGGAGAGAGSAERAADRKAEIPDVAGLNEGTAAGRLTRALLKPETRSQPSDSVPAGKVIGTDPAAGSRVAKGARITVLVSSGS